MTPGVRRFRPGDPLIPTLAVWWMSTWYNRVHLVDGRRGGSDQGIPGSDAPQCPWLRTHNLESQGIPVQPRGHKPKAYGDIREK